MDERWEEDAQETATKKRAAEPGAHPETPLPKRQDFDATIPPTWPLSEDEACGDDRQVCYGTLLRVRCQRSPKTDLESTNTAAITTNEYGSGAALIVRYRENECTVMRLPFYTEPFAKVNVKAGNAFSRCASIPAVELVFYSNTSERKDAPSPAPSRRKARIILVDVNVYGKRRDAATVGSILSDAQLFLQEPLGAQNLEYCNPHKLSFTGLSEIDIWMEELAMNSGGQTNETDWGVILDHLPQHRLAGAHADNSQLTTVLMPHQLDGQDFMVGRETGLIGDERRYWHLDHSDDYVPIFRHSVTAAEEFDRPVEPRGGIVADAMGLGKTFTTIAVIACSLDRAAKFATDKPTMLPYPELTHTHATLVVAPSMLILDGWIKEVERRTQRNALKYTRYHGHERARHFSDLVAYDIVFTTFGTVTTEHRKLRSRKALFHLRWYRIVLDEAHTIRSQHTKQFDAVMALQGEHHWCLTGTPISNRADDLGALLAFCRVPLLQDRACFREAIVKPARKSFRYGCELVGKALAPICLRRTRDIVELSEPSRVQCDVSLSHQEVIRYRLMIQQCRKALDVAISKRSLSDKKHTVLKSILQMRIFCNHGTFMPIQPMQDDYLDADEALTLLQQEDKASCSSCGSSIELLAQLEDTSSAIKATCEHVLCNSCHKDSTEDRTSAELVCPVCNDQVQEQSFEQPHDARVSAQGAGLGYSSKFEKLLINLQDSCAREKSLVFSSWKKSINIISRLCTAKGLKHVCIHGKIQQWQRRQALQQFVNDDSTSVLLMTMGTGALGLNLEAATRIHIVEPQWNPAVEEQAIGRAIRIGQANKTTVIRYVVKDSLEEHIQTYQKRKLLLAAGGFGDTPEAQAEAHTKLLTATFLRNM